MPMMLDPRATIWLAIFLTIQSVWPGAAHGAGGSATASDWVQTDYGAVRLIAATDGFDAKGNMLLGVEFRVLKGWNIGWRLAGETGTPTRFDWSGSVNVGITEALWPIPTRYSAYDMQSFGYDTRVIFPITTTVRETRQPAAFNVAVSYVVCREICIPLTATMSLPIAGVSLSPARSKYAQSIENFLARVPRRIDDATLNIRDVYVRESHVSSELFVVLGAASPIENPDVALEVAAAYRIGRPDVHISLDRRTARLRMPYYRDEGTPALEGADVNIVAWDANGKSVEQTVRIRRQKTADRDW